MQKKDPLLRAPSSVGRYNSTRVDEGRKCRILLATKMKARTVVGRGEEGPLCDPGSELLLEGRARVHSARKINGMKKTKEKCPLSNDLAEAGPTREHH